MDSRNNFSMREWLNNNTRDEKGLVMYELYSRKERLYYLFCGLVIALSLVWITYLFFETRAARIAWNEEFTTPQEFWAEVPKWEWKKVIS